MKTKWLPLWAALAVVGACDAPGPTSPSNPAGPTVHDVEVDPPESSLLVGDTLRLTARPKSADGRLLGGVAVTWSSQAEEIATVAPRGSQGRVTASRAGTAVISASAGGKTGRATVAVANPVPSAGSLEPTSVEAGVGGFTLVVRGGGFVADSRVRWNGVERAAAFVGPTELRATIDAADAASEGSAEVRVVSPAPGGGTSGTLTFRVTAPEPPPPGAVASVQIDVTSVDLEEGATARLTATARDARGIVVTGRFVRWTSSDPEVAPVGAMGAVTGIRSGTAVITARVDGASTSIPARVWADYPYDLVYSGWDGADPSTMRSYGTDLGDGTRSAVRIGPDAPNGGAVPSPDGTRLAYVLELGGGARALMVADRGGSGAVELHRTTDVGCGRLTWSPDGERLAFACRIGDGDLDIWAVDADGTDLVNLTDAHPGHQEWPSWSPILPGGTFRIAYAQYVDGEPRIWTMKDDGTDPRQLTGGIDAQPAWSPDGTTIAFQRTGAAIFGDLWLVDAAGGGERSLVGAYLAGAQDAPAWSPDARMIAFGSTHETYGAGSPAISRVYTVWADGSRLARRTGDGMAARGPAWRVR